MTPRQIAEIYFHERDADGRIVFPDAPQPPKVNVDPRADLLDRIDLAYGNGRITAQRYEELKKKAAAKFPEAVNGSDS